MEYLLRCFSTRIAQIVYRLEFDQFLTLEGKALLQEELSSLLSKRNRLIKTINEMKECEE
tara:strand:- start:475 stop:654 length:180 start_codon:yes stop_codon:yes gene_type:complete